MVNITLDATLRVAAGPTLDVGAALDLDSYSASQLVLKKAASTEVALLPEAKQVALLAVRVRTEDGAAADVEMATKNAKGAGVTVVVSGGLVVASKDVLAALVKDGGPRTLTFANKGDPTIVVDVIAALD